MPTKCKITKKFSGYSVTKAKNTKTKSKIEKLTLKMLKSDQLVTSRILRSACNNDCQIDTEFNPKTHNRVASTFTKDAVTDSSQSKPVSSLILDCPVTSTADTKLADNISISESTQRDKHAKRCIIEAIGRINDREKRLLQRAKRSLRHSRNVTDILSLRKDKQDDTSNNCNSDDELMKTTQKNTLLNGYTFLKSSMTNEDYINPQNHDESNPSNAYSLAQSKQYNSLRHPASISYRLQQINKQWDTPYSPPPHTLFKADHAMLNLYPKDCANINSAISPPESIPEQNILNTNCLLGRDTELMSISTSSSISLNHEGNSNLYGTTNNKDIESLEKGSIQSSLIGHTSAIIMKHEDYNDIKDNTESDDTTCAVDEKDLDIKIENKNQISRYSSKTNVDLADQICVSENKSKNIKGKGKCKKILLTDDKVKKKFINSKIYHKKKNIFTKIKNKKVLFFNGNDKKKLTSKKVSKNPINDTTLDYKKRKTSNKGLHFRNYQNHPPCTSCSSHSSNSELYFHHSLSCHDIGSHRKKNYCNNQRKPFKHSSDLHIVRRRKNCRICCCENSSNESIQYSRYSAISKCNKNPSSYSDHSISTNSVFCNKTRNLHNKDLCMVQKNVRKDYRSCNHSICSEKCKSKCQMKTCGMKHNYITSSDHYNDKSLQKGKSYKMGHKQLKDKNNKHFNNKFNLSLSNEFHSNKSKDLKIRKLIDLIDQTPHRSYSQRH